MKKLMFFICLSIPLYSFGADTTNLVVNGSFDINPWNKGWTSSVSGEGWVMSCNTKYYSAPTSCKIEAVGYVPEGQFSEVTMSQTITPAVSCTVSTWYQYTDYGNSWYIDWIAINLRINNKDSTVEVAPSQGNPIGSRLTWTQRDWTLTNKDTITGITFKICIEAPPAEEYTDTLDFWIDDVSIKGTPVTGIEENAKCLMPNAELNAYPNPFMKETNIKWSSVNNQKVDKIQIYDISGKLVKTTNNTIIGNDLKEGVYFIKLNDNKKMPKIIKIGR